MMEEIIFKPERHEYAYTFGGAAPIRTGETRQRHAPVVRGCL
jgi:hypothetical protein